MLYYTCECLNCAPRRIIPAGGQKVDVIDLKRIVCEALGASIFEVRAVFCNRQPVPEVGEQVIFECDTFSIFVVSP